MNIAVCIKQVPILSAMEFDASSRSLKRDGVRTEVSAFDIRAVIKAVELRTIHGGEVVAVTMGPPQARASLIECLALGADRALHVCDPALAGSDTLATAKALAAALKTIDFDLILAGRCSVDAETGQVGPELAELLDLPQITAAHTLEIDTSAQTLTAERETDEGYERLSAKLPALVTAAEDLAQEHFPNRAARDAAAHKPVETVNLQHLGVDPQAVGLAGSPTVVAEIRAVETTRRQQLIEAATIEDAAGRLAEILIADHGLFGTWNVHEQPELADVVDAPPRKNPRDVLVIAECSRASRIRPVTGELITKARELADALGSTVSVLLAGTAVAHHVSALALHGADRVLLAEDSALAGEDVEVQAHVVATAIRRLAPGIVLLAATSLGRDLAPRVAARLGLGLTGDCIDIGLDAQGRLLQYKPAFGGTIVAPILSRTIPEMATVRPGMLKAHGASPVRSTEVIRMELGELPEPRVQLIGFRDIAEAATELDNAEIVLGVGKGVGGKDGIAELRPIAEFLGASICATRDVTDEGWLPRQYQVGLTGRAIAPKLYLAIAIRGAFEHMVGVRRAGLVVAFNKNPKAPIFKAADYGIVGDYKESMSALHRHLERLRSRA